MKLKYKYQYIFYVLNNVFYQKDIDTTDVSKYIKSVYNIDIDINHLYKYMVYLIHWGYIRPSIKLTLIEKIPLSMDTKMLTKCYDVQYRKEYKDKLKQLDRKIKIKKLKSKK